MDGCDSEFGTEDLELDSEWNFDSGHANVLPELRILLIGNGNSDKSLARNTILGRASLDTKTQVHSLKRQAEVAGRKITLVEAPGWWKTRSIEDSAEVLKQELVLSVSLCLPGPHTVLVVIDGDSVFTEKQRKIFEGFINLFGERVWSHCIVLFFFDDGLRHPTVEQYIESEGETLQWLVEKCENRYHALKSNKKNDKNYDATQVTELLEKIEELVIGNNGCPYEVNSAVLLQLEQNRMVEKERGKERKMKLQRQRRDMRSRMGQNDHLSELRIVLLGYRNAGRSAAGNTILGRTEFNLDRTIQCVQKQGEVAGKKVTVVEAPGWWSNRPIEDSIELLKQEIMLSVSLCPPGPHVVLVVLSLKFDFKECDRKVLEGYVMLLGERVWKHAIVLFSYGDWLGDMAVEQYIECEGNALQWLLDQCGNRYHVFNNELKGDSAQVTVLLDMIEEVVAGNGGSHFDVGSNILLELEEKRTRAQERMMRVQKQRQDSRSQMGNDFHLSELRIVMIGYINSGRSSAGNTILDRKDFDLGRTTKCVMRQGKVAGKKITVVEAPGWWSNHSIEDSTELLKQEIVLSVSLCPPGPHVVLVVVSLKFDFKETDRSVLESHLMLLGEGVWRHALVLFTCGDYLLNKTIEQGIECEGKALQWLVDKCGNRYHVFNNSNKDDGTQVRELLEKLEELVAGNDSGRFEIDPKILQEVEQKRRAEEQRAKERMMKVQQQRENMKAFIDLRKRRHAGTIITGSNTSNKRSQGVDGVAESELTLMTDPREWRSASPVPSYLSMKTDWSMDFPPKFSEEASRTEQSILTEDLTAVSGVCLRCSEVLQDPVSVPCGHLYCRPCVEACRTQFGLADDCPMCNDTISAPTAGIQALKVPSPKAPSPDYDSGVLGDVECDFCIETKRKALKSCLTCTASYCESHVRQHYTVPALQSHTLLDATGDLKQRLCQVHHRALEVFCATDKMHICTMCVLCDHRGHDVKLEPAAGNKNGAAGASELGDKQEPRRFNNRLLCFFCVLLGGAIVCAIMFAKN